MITYDIYRKHLKSEGKAELLTFALAMLSTKINCRNYVIFGKLNCAVTPFLIKFLLLAYQVLTGEAQTNMLEKLLGLQAVAVNVWADRG